MTANPEILFNIFILLFSVWVLMTLNNKIIRPTRLNEKRFKLYKLRDELALLAIEGNYVKENSDEYVILMNIINRNIASTKDFKITTFVYRLGQFAQNKNEQKRLEAIIKKIEHDELPDEYKTIVKKVFLVSREIFNHKTWFLQKLITPFIIIFASLGASIKIFKRFSERLESNKKTMKQTNSYYDKTIERIIA